MLSIFQTLSRKKILQTVVLSIFLSGIGFIIIEQQIQIVKLQKEKFNLHQSQSLSSQRAKELEAIIDSCVTSLPQDANSTHINNGSVKDIGISSPYFGEPDISIDSYKTCNTPFKLSKFFFGTNKYPDRFLVSIWELQNDLPHTYQNIHFCYESSCQKIPIASILLDSRPYLSKQGIDMYITDRDPSIFFLDMSTISFFDDSDPNKSSFVQISVLDDQSKYAGHDRKAYEAGEVSAAKNMLLTIADSISID